MATSDLVMRWAAGVGVLVALVLLGASAYMLVTKRPLPHRRSLRTVQGKQQPVRAGVFGVLAGAGVLVGNVRPFLFPDSHIAVAVTLGVMLVFFLLAAVWWRRTGR